MSSKSRARLGVLVLVHLVLASLGLTLPRAAAHEGHDHAAPQPTATAPASPRVVATSESYQLVGIVEGEVLVIYLDRQADNTPVTAAKLEVTIGEAPAAVEFIPKNGTYEATSALLKQPGTHEVLIAIAEDQASDLLVGSAKIEAGGTAQKAHGLDHSLWDHLKATVFVPNTWARWLSWGGLALVGLLLVRKYRGAAPAVIVLLLGGTVLMASVAVAHEGHDHGAAQGVAASGNAPQRLPDGTIFVPKPTQRLLEVRTRIIEPETTSKSVRLVGRVVANPNKSGVVQSTIQGRFQPPVEGVATIGTRVKAGDVLGSVAPSFISKDSSDMTQTLGELDQQISLARTKLARQEALLKTNVVAKAAVDETRIQLDGYLKRRQELLASRIQPEELRAPVDGVITAVRVMAGQVVSQTDQLFSIVDTSSLMVEALAFDQSIADKIENAVAIAGGHVATRLKFVGRSRALQQQYSVLKFEVLEPSPAMNVGTPVTITGRNGEQVTGIILPRAAIAQAPNGQMVVFRHKEPEIFEPKPVRFEPFDAQSVLLQAGIEAGDKVVVQGAPLVNQVR